MLPHTNAHFSPASADFFYESKLPQKNISKTYRQASTLFLTRRLPEALSTVLPLVTPPEPTTDENDDDGDPAPVAQASRSTRIKVWSLYLTILNAIVELEPDEGKDAFGSQEWRSLCNSVRDGLIWDEVVRNGYHGVEADVDSDVVINLATLLLAHARDQILNQNKLENYLASASTPNLDISDRLSSASPGPRNGYRRRSPSKGPSGANTPRDLNARVKILELYTLHVLIRNNEWDYSREFISMSAVLDEERRDAFLQALQSLQEEQEAQERHEREERERQEDKLRRDIEEMARLRAENEARERRRIEEERARREAASSATTSSEVDYGVDDDLPRSCTGGSVTSRSGPATSSSAEADVPSSRTGPRSVRPSLSGRASNGKAKTPGSAAPLSFTARASIVMGRLRTIIEQLGMSLNNNPALLVRLLMFVMSLVFMFGSKAVRERVQRVLGTSWAKISATAGMGTKVSYI
ncbi:Peroxin 26 [Geosmithia morbida]|uniref:Peroxin 26 n=1 Tax=Geosmithia morbida TaxID=1094350 RepID=A0A9P4YT33_9HYPO|nr:Peroxin 26 [Geosmithia morbida]KAF4121312.1 Peroxin 26 [Geosmithia morbida]